MAAKRGNEPDTDSVGATRKDLVDFTLARRRPSSCLTGIVSAAWVYLIRAPRSERRDQCLPTVPLMTPCPPKNANNNVRRRHSWETTLLARNDDRVGTKGATSNAQSRRDSDQCGLAYQQL